MTEDWQKTFDYLTGELGNFGTELKTVEPMLSNVEKKEILQHFMSATALIRIKSITAEISRRRVEALDMCAPMQSAPPTFP